MAAQRTAEGNAVGPAAVFLVPTATPDSRSTAGRVLVIVHVSSFENPTLDFSAHAMLVADSCLPQHNQLEFNFLQGKDPALSNHLKEVLVFSEFLLVFWCTCPSAHETCNTNPLVLGAFKLD